MSERRELQATHVNGCMLTIGIINFVLWLGVIPAIYMILTGQWNFAVLVAVLALIPLLVLGALFGRILAYMFYRFYWHFLGFTWLSGISFGIITIAAMISNPSQLIENRNRLGLSSSPFNLSTITLPPTEHIIVIILAVIGILTLLWILTAPLRHLRRHESSSEDEKEDTHSKVGLSKVDIQLAERYRNLK